MLLDLTVCVLSPYRPDTDVTASLHDQVDKLEKHLRYVNTAAICHFPFLVHHLPVHSFQPGAQMRAYRLTSAEESSSSVWWLAPHYLGSIHFVSVTISSLPHYGPDGKHRGENVYMLSSHSQTRFDIKGPPSVPWYSNSFRHFLCYRLKSPTSRSLHPSLQGKLPNTKRWWGGGKKQGWWRLEGKGGPEGKLM